MKLKVSILALLSAIIGFSTPALANPTHVGKYSCDNRKSVEITNTHLYVDGVTLTYKQSQVVDNNQTDAFVRDDILAIFGYIMTTNKQKTEKRQLIILRLVNNSTEHVDTLPCIKD